MNSPETYRAPKYLRSVEWSFVIATDSYAGNFERDMCAYVTGRIGECGVGTEYQEIFQMECQGYEVDSVELRINPNDSYPVMRPTSMVQIETSDGKRAYNGVQIYFAFEPTYSEIEFMKERAYKFAGLKEQSLKILGFFVLKEITTSETKIV
jgi:hypothetical protein